MNKTSRADVVLLLVTIIAAGGWLFSKFTLAEMPPLAFLGLRFLAASILLALFYGYHFKKLTRMQWFHSFWVGIAHSAALLVWILAIASSTRIGEGAFLTSTSMILVPVIGRLFFGSHITKEILVAFPLALVGVALLAIGSSWKFELAQGLFLTAAIFLAIHFNLNSQYGRKVPSLALASIQLAIIGGSGLIASLLFETWPQTISPSTWGWFATSVIVATSIRFFLQTWAQKHTDASHAAVIMILEPVWTAIISVAWLGEIMTLQKIFGCALILVALLISRWQQIYKLKPRKTGAKASIKSAKAT